MLGGVGTSWNELCTHLKFAFPSLRDYSNSHISNLLRSKTPIRSLVAKQTSMKLKPMENIKKQLIVASFIVKILLEEHPILFFDETILSSSNFKKTALGSKVFVPLRKNYTRKSIRFLTIFGLDGTLGIQVTDKDTDSKDIVRFFQSAIPKIQSQLPDHDKNKRIVVFLDNARVQKTKKFQDLVKKLPIVIFYNIPCSPWINMIEDFFLIMKRPFKKRFYSPDQLLLKEVFLAIKNSFLAGTKWIENKFYQNAKRRCDFYLQAAKYNIKPSHLKRTNLGNEEPYEPINKIMTKINQG